MDKEYFDALAKVRLDRARELIEEAKALLATKETEVATHNGSLKQFNYLFIY